MILISLLSLFFCDELAETKASLGQGIELAASAGGGVVSKQASQVLDRSLKFKIFGEKFA